MKRLISAIATALLVAVSARADDVARRVWRPDEFIATKIQIGLQTMPGINPRTIIVESQDGHVRLSGTVPTVEGRARVIDMAREVEGVKGVQDALQVAPDTTQASADAVRPADAIQTEIVARLSADKELRGSEIGVTVGQDGAVVMSGFATSLDDELRAMRIARSVDGVASIRNEVTSPPDTLYDIDLGSGAAPVGADVRNRQERQAAEGIAAEQPPAGDAPSASDKQTERNPEGHASH